MKDSPPAVSIIVPVYNTEQYLRQCVTSILGQTFRELEVILVNDGSPDDAAEVMEELALADSRVVTVHQKNRGLPGARNAGLAMARGTYIGFVDSDDWITPYMYEILIAAIADADADVAMCDYQTVNGEERARKSSRIRGGAYSRQQILDEIFPTLIMDDDLEGPDVLSVWRCLYRREFLAERRISFDEGAKYSEDYLFSLAAMLRAQSFVYAKHRNEYLYRHNPESISRTVKRDSWRTYVYLNRAMQLQLSAVEGTPLSDSLARQLKLHMLYFALNTANRITGSAAPTREKYAMLREIVGSERLQEAFAELSLPRYPALTRAKIACLRLRIPAAMLMLDRVARTLRRQR